jgi:hypothetical protein
MNVKLLILLCFERLGGHNSRKCIIFNVCDSQELTFLKPRTTLIYPKHVPKYLWWAFMMSFTVDLTVQCQNGMAIPHLTCRFWVAPC